MISTSNFFISQLEYHHKRLSRVTNNEFFHVSFHSYGTLNPLLKIITLNVHDATYRCSHIDRQSVVERRRSQQRCTFFRWQGWVLRSQCCRRHRRKIQTIARLSPPVIVASVPFVESRRKCHPEEERSPRGNRSRDGRCGGTRHGNNERRRRRVCCTRLGNRCCDRCPGRRWRCSTIGRLASFNSRPKRGEASFTCREELHARRALVSFVLFLPADDDSYDLLSPLYDPWSRWIIAT